MKYKAVLFDMDGTIVTTNDIWSKATQEIINRRVQDVCPKKLAHVMQHVNGLGLPESCKVIIEYFNFNEPVEQIIKEKEELALSWYQQHLDFMPGFHNFFKKVEEKQLKKAIATNATEKTLQHTNEKLNLDIFFDQHMYSIDCVGGACKPQPDIFLHAAQQVQAQPEECIVIEDSAHGVKAAKAAGMYCIEITQDKERHHSSPADLVVSHFDEIDLNRLLTT